MSEGATVMSLSNIELGRLLDLSHAQVSRIRSGDRLPSIDSMVRIEEVLGWKVQDQVRARTAGKYAEQFESAVLLYASNRDSTTGPGERAPTP